MKIIAGKYKGRNFFMPSGIRPTQNIVRKSVFDTIGQDLKDCCFLELFAGSGAMGLEALSRGAKEVTFVEKDSRCINVLKENIELLHIYNNINTIETLNLDSFAAIKKMAHTGRKFDIVFADPPFGLGLSKKTLKTLEAYDILQPNCIMIIQCECHEALPERLGRFLYFRQKKHGSSNLTFYNSI